MHSFMSLGIEGVWQQLNATESHEVEVLESLRRIDRRRRL
jgi:hypothetical protein